MLKLIKYEFRKSRTSLLVMLCIAAALFLLAPLGSWLEKRDMMVVSVILLFMYSFAAYVLVLVRGVTAYSGELKSKSGYLLLMLPRSTASILFSKLLFTVFFGFAMLAICAAALFGSGMLFVSESFEVKGFLNIINYALAEMGISLSAIGSIALLGVMYIVGSVITLVSVCYLSVTLSATLLQERRGRGFVSAVLVVAIIWLVETIGSLLTRSIADRETLIYSFTVMDALRAMIPVFAADFALSAFFTWLSALLLKYKVSL